MMGTKNQGGNVGSDMNNAIFTALDVSITIGNESKTHHFHFNMLKIENHEEEFKRVQNF